MAPDRPAAEPDCVPRGLHACGQRMGPVREGTGRAALRAADAAVRGREEAAGGGRMKLHLRLFGWEFVAEVVRREDECCHCRDDGDGRFYFDPHHRRWMPEYPEA